MGNRMGAILKPSDQQGFQIICWHTNKSPGGDSSRDWTLLSLFQFCYYFTIKDTEYKDDRACLWEYGALVSLYIRPPQPMRARRAEKKLRQLSCVVATVFTTFKIHPSIIPDAAVTKDRPKSKTKVGICLFTFGVCHSLYCTSLILYLERPQGAREIKFREFSSDIKGLLAVEYVVLFNEDCREECNIIRGYQM